MKGLIKLCQTSLSISDQTQPSVLGDKQILHHVYSAISMEFHVKLKKSPLTLLSYHENVFFTNKLKKFLNQFLGKSFCIFPINYANMQISMTGKLFFNILGHRNTLANYRRRQICRLVILPKKIKIKLILLTIFQNTRRQKDMTNHTRPQGE